MSNKNMLWLGFYHLNIYEMAVFFNFLNSRQIIFEIHSKLKATQMTHLCIHAVEAATTDYSWMVYYRVL